MTSPRFRAFLIWLSAVMTVCFLTSVTLPPLPSEDTWIVAHRGASGHAPENTMAAFELAVQRGADYIELDVRMTKDGELVVIHDATLDRTTDGTGPVAQWTMADIQALDAGVSFAPAYEGEHVPALREVLERFAGRAGILIELKTPKQYPGLEEKLAELLRTYGQAGGRGEIGEGRGVLFHTAPVIIQSFDLDAIRRLKAKLPEIPVAALVGEHPDQPLPTGQQLKDIVTYADFINANYELLTRDVVASIHHLGCKVMAWTIRDRQDMDRMLKLGVDGIITDYPAWGRPSKG